MKFRNLARILMFSCGASLLIACNTLSLQRKELSEREFLESYESTIPALYPKETPSMPIFYPENSVEILNMYDSAKKQKVEELLKERQRRLWYKGDLCSEEEKQLIKEVEKRRYQNQKL